eukprot:4458225-Prymnesium_polylepis.2
MEHAEEKPLLTARMAVGPPAEATAAVRAPYALLESRLDSTGRKGGTDACYCYPAPELSCFGSRVVSRVRIRPMTMAQHSHVRACTMHMRRAGARRRDCGHVGLVQAARAADGGGRPRAPCTRARAHAGRRAWRGGRRLAAPRRGADERGAAAAAAERGGARIAG